jgi:hypothetical protein
MDYSFNSVLDTWHSIDRMAAGIFLVSQHLLET